MSFEYENLENLNIQLIDGDRGKNYPKQSEFQESGYCLFLSAKNVTKSGFQFSEKVYVSEERHNLLRAGKLERYDIVLTTRGTIGNVAFYDNSVLDDVVRVNSGMLILRANTTVWNPRFLYFLFTSKIIQEQISSLTSGSAVPQLPAKDLRKFLLPKVPMGVQNYIVKVIGDLSDKLKINDQTNQTLEEMAQAIFKSWFVDFDPVKAKMNGEQPEGMDAATASLFPEKLVESELGLIPEGWELTTVGKVSECFDKRRVPLSKRQREERQGSIPYYGATSVMDYVDEAIFDDIYLLIGEDGSVMKADGTPFVQYIWGPAWVNNHAHVLKGIKSVSTEQLMLFFQQTNINAYVTGAVQLKINQRNMNSIPFVKATEEVNQRFYDVVAPLYAKMRAIKEENEQLAKLRDTLLPKLLSGEIELVEQS
ncbi:restriction endonuclease subunit S [Vibrio parahaemolyticus]|uniref:restriction endonuclease subunit S n=1 Tax=Vibrio parahaemolyticus TaxID=670 RepID=UPI000472647F|nr:restriction endonuclease subunit S [Vibrio parahaemolyticus]